MDAFTEVVGVVGVVEGEGDGGEGVKAADGGARSTFFLGQI